MIRGHLALLQMTLGSVRRGGGREGCRPRSGSTPGPSCCLRAHCVLCWAAAPASSARGAPLKCRSNCIPPLPSALLGSLRPLTPGPAFKALPVHVSLSAGIFSVAAWCPGRIRRASRRARSGALSDCSLHA